MCRLPAPTKVFLQLKHNTDASSIKSISGVTLSENARSQGIFIKCRAVFDIEIKLCIIFTKEGSFDIRTQYRSNDHVAQSFEVFYSGYFFLFACLW